VDSVGVDVGAGLGGGVGVSVGAGVEATDVGATAAALTTGAAEATSVCKSHTGSRQRCDAVQRSAPSKLNCPVSVPTAPLTLTAARIAEPPYACGTHATAVADVHALLPHTSAVVSEALTLALKLPKLSPLTVTVPPPLGTALAETVLTTDAAPAPSACKSHTGSRQRCGAAQRTVEAELPRQRAHRSTQTHRSPHRRAAVRLRNARNRCRRRPRAAAAHVRRGERGSHACA
jgi:hypothetical protein